jgi:hypothetical protein
MEKLPKILVSCPTASAKNYTALQWILNTQKFTYPNYDVVVFNNDDDNGANANYLNKLAIDNGVLNFKAIHYSDKKHNTIIERMCISHNLARELTINGGYSHLLHLESDVICPNDALQNLYIHSKKVVGALYYRDSGKSRRLMAQRRINRSSKNVITENFLPNEDAFFVDGTLKPVAHIGLGCVLISVDVLKDIKFRYIEGVDMHPDSYFAEDCFRNNIKIFADTNIICEHNNEDWDIYGLNWK